MTGSATGLWSRAARGEAGAALLNWRGAAGVLLAPMIAVPLLASPAVAQRAVTDETVTAGDVVRMPLDDLNINRDPIPRTLLLASEAPYNSAGLDDCAEVRTEIADLDAVLGEDLDMILPVKREGLRAGKIAKSMLGTLIPYRGLIREVSGANRHAEAFKEAIAAGMMRRAYLKGLGQAMDCPYPARPAPPEVIARTILKLEEEAPAEEDEATQGREVPVARAEN